MCVPHLFQVMVVSDQVTLTLICMVETQAHTHAHAHKYAHTQLIRALIVSVEPTQVHLMILIMGLASLVQTHHSLDELHLFLAPNITRL